MLQKLIMWILCHLLAITLNVLNVLEISIYSFGSFNNRSFNNECHKLQFIIEQWVIKMWFVRVMLCLMSQSTWRIMGLKFLMKLGIKSNHPLPMSWWVANEIQWANMIILEKDYMSFSPIFFFHMNEFG